MNILEKYRKEKGLTYDELAKKMGITSTSVWRLCNNGIKCPKSVAAISKLLKLKKATVFEKMMREEND